MFEELKKHREEVANNIAKSFATDFEKAVYVNNAENRKLGRVGLPYGGKSSEKNYKSYLANRKNTRLQNGATLIEGNGHKYIEGNKHYTKAEFVSAVKTYLKESGEKFDSSKIMSSKQIGYDHIMHNQYYYVFQGNPQEEEREFSAAIDAKYRKEGK